MIPNDIEVSIQFIDPDIITTIVFRLIAIDTRSRFTCHQQLAVIKW